MTNVLNKLFSTEHQPTKCWSTHINPNNVIDSRTLRMSSEASGWLLRGKLRIKRDESGTAQLVRNFQKNSTPIIIRERAPMLMAAPGVVYKVLIICSTRGRFRSCAAQFAEHKHARTPQRDNVDNIDHDNERMCLFSGECLRIFYKYHFSPETEWIGWMRGRGNKHTHAIVACVFSAYLCLCEFLRESVVERWAWHGEWMLSNQTHRTDAMRKPLVPYVRILGHIYHKRASGKRTNKKNCVTGCTPARWWWWSICEHTHKQTNTSAALWFLENAESKKPVLTNGHNAVENQPVYAACIITTSHERTMPAEMGGMFVLRSPAFLWRTTQPYDIPPPWRMMSAKRIVRFCSCFCGTHSIILFLWQLKVSSHSGMFALRKSCLFACDCTAENSILFTFVVTGWPNTKPSTHKTEQTRFVVTIWTPDMPRNHTANDVWNVSTHNKRTIAYGS